MIFLPSPKHINTHIKPTPSIPPQFQKKNTIFFPRMDDGFPVEFWHTDLYWLDAPIPVSDPAPGQISAFVPYLPQPAIGSRQKNNPITATTITATYSENVHKRVIEYWRKRWQEKKKPAEMGDLERERSHRHMLNERMRREKHRQSYSELHSMLPIKVKVLSISYYCGES